MFFVTHDCRFADFVKFSCQLYGCNCDAQLTQYLWVAQCARRWLVRVPAVLAAGAVGDTGWASRCLQPGGEISQTRPGIVRLMEPSRAPATSPPHHELIDTHAREAGRHYWKMHYFYHWSWCIFSKFFVFKGNSFYHLNV